jgi:hypothetical protein
VQLSGIPDMYKSPGEFPVANPRESDLIRHYLALGSFASLEESLADTSPKVEPSPTRQKMSAQQTGTGTRL